MAFKVYTGSFTAPGGTGNQSVAGIGFQPKIIMFFGGVPAADINSKDSNTYFGAAISSTSRASVASSSDDGLSTSQAYRYTEEDSCIHIINPNGPTYSKADFVSMDTLGFTINWNIAAVSTVNFIALGGDDLTDVKITQVLSRTTNGTKADTTVGFKPDCLIMFGATMSALNQLQGTSLLSLGFGTSSTEQGSSGYFAATGTGVSATAVWQSSDHIYTTATGSTPAPWVSCKLDSLDTNGFTLNYDYTSGTARKLIVISLKGGQYKVGAETQRITNTGTKVTAGVGFTPKGLLLKGSGAVANASAQNGGGNIIGAVSSTSERAYVASDDLDNISPTIVNNRLSTNKCFGTLTAASPVSGAVVTSEADLSSFNADGFTLNWTTVADSVEREFLYLAFGDNAAAGGVKPYIQYYQYLQSGGQIGL